MIRRRFQGRKLQAQVVRGNAAEMGSRGTAGGLGSDCHLPAVVKPRRHGHTDAADSDARGTPPVKIDPTGLPGVLILTPAVFSDARGAFSETWNRARLAEAGIALDFVQDNQSFSAAVGTVRGLHYQAPPRAQDKLVRVLAGAVLDVAVDVRRGSPHFGRWVGVELSAGNGRQLLVPKGFLHGFVTLAPDTVVFYKCSDYYAPDCDGAVAFADPDLAIDWGIDPEAAVVSDKDARAPRFADWDSPFAYDGPLPWEAP
jgi:dTDP-4-dehydrorhamnose 3,5-epimerase